MAGLARLTVAETPDWVVEEMPPGYQTRMAEIRRLSDEMHAMDEIGRVLWQTGEPLRRAVRALLGTLKCDLGSSRDSDGPIVVKLDNARRLLILVADAVGPIEKTSEELARAFQLLQHADDHDRLVLVTNADPTARPADRPDAVTEEALKVVQRMGLNVLETSTLFGLWRLSMQDGTRAHKLLDRLHTHDGGPLTIA